MTENISYSEFEKVDIRVGTILEAVDFPEARKPAYKLKIDLGDIGIKSSSVQVTELYSKDDLLGKQVVCVVNLSPKNIGPFVSEVLTTGFDTEKGVVLATVDTIAGNGLKLF